MTKQVLILGNRGTLKDPVSYYEGYKKLFDESARVANIGCAVHTALIEDLYISVGPEEFTIRDTKNQVNVQNYDLIMLRGMGFRGLFDVLFALSQYCVKHGTKLINSYDRSYDFSKLAQAVRLTEGGLAVPQTVYVTSAVTSNQTNLSFGFPCIMKDVHGAHGNDNYIVNSLDEVRRIAQNNPDIRFIVQAFVPNSGDLRVLVLGDRTLMIKRQAIDGTHLNNTSKGGSASLVAADEAAGALLEIALSAAKILDMTCAGVDIITDEISGKQYVLEVNSQPQLHTGAFLSEKQQLVADHLKDLYGN